MNESFDKAFDKVISLEGNYTNDYNDRGNWTSGVVGKGELKGTKFGISAMAYPSLDIKNLTIKKAKEIYYRDYWAEIGLDRLDPILSCQIFDSAVQHGKSTAIKLLQKVLGITADGVAGTNTINCAKNQNQKQLALQYISQRLSYYTQIKTFNLYGKGWVNRMIDNLNTVIKEVA